MTEREGLGANGNTYIINTEKGERMYDGKKKGVGGGNAYFDNQGFKKKVGREKFWLRLLACKKLRLSG